MANYAVRCSCGKETVVSEWALGAPVKCRACGKPLSPTEKNTRAVDEPKGSSAATPREEDALPPPLEARVAQRAARSAPPRPGAPAQGPRPVMPVPPGASAPPEPEPTPVRSSKCGRCGRAFRGDWDRYHRTGTVVCHICANQYQAEPEEDPAAVAAAAPPPVASQYKGVLDDPILPDPDAPTVGDIRETNEQIRKWVMVAGISCMVVVGFLLATGALDTDEGVRLPPMTPDVVGKTVEKLPQSAIYLTQAVLFVFRLVTTVAALYLLLHWRDKLPNSFFLGNVLHITMVAGFIHFLGLVILMVPCLGVILHMVLSIYILWEVYDLEFADFIMLAVFFFVLDPLVQVLKLFALGIIGLIYT